MSETPSSPWDRLWQSPDYTWGDLEQEQLEFYLAMVPHIDGAQVLEVGSGSAKMASALAARGAILTCADFSKMAIDIGQAHFKKRCIKGTFIQSDMRSLPLMDGTFDLTYSSGVLEHYDDTGIFEAIAEMYRVTKPGGVVANFVPYAGSVFYRLAAWHLRLDGRTVDSLHHIYEELGCVETGEFTCGFLTSLLWFGQCPHVTVDLLDDIKRWHSSLSSDEKAKLPGYVLGSWARKPPWN